MGELHDGQYTPRYTFEGVSDAILTHSHGHTPATRETPIFMLNGGSTWTHPGMAADHSILSRIPECVLRVEMAWCRETARVVAVVVDVPSRVHDRYSQRMAS